jgi:hypothetical protein
MADENEHAAVVTAWLESCAPGLPSKRLAALFEQALQALWGRAHVTLGDVTLSAIVDRVLHVAADEHPVFSGVKIDASGIRLDEFRDQAESLPVEQLAAGIRFVLIEFLSVLGSLTAEILTSPLHAQLLRVVPEEPPRSKGGTSARAPGARRTKDPES